MGLAYKNSYLVHEYSKTLSDGPQLREDVNAVDARQATAWHEPSNYTSIDEDAIYENQHLYQETYRDPALKDQTRKHLLYAQWVNETNAEPIDPNSVTVLTTRLGRTVIRATRRDDTSTIIRILSPEIAMDAFTKIDAYRQQITDAGVAVPETRYGSSLVEWRRYGKPPETQAMGYQVQSFEGDGTTLQDLVDAQPPGPEQQKAYEYVYTQIGRIMLKLHSTSAPRAYPYRQIPYGQYGSAQGGEIAHWGSFSEYLNHMLAFQEFAISAMQATELPLGINTKMIKQAMAVVYQDMGSARMLPHLIHGDLRPPNMLANGFVVDWDYAGYGNTWSELVKPCRHIYRNE